MSGGDAADQPFDAIAETVNEQSADGLKLLGNETRLAIIVALWDAIDTIPSEMGSQGGLSFSELYDRVGVEDSGQFNYHLDKLIGTFVDHDDGTYTLSTPGYRILAAVISGAVADPPSFTDEPLDGDCPLCGGSVLIDYEDGTLRVRCTECEGNSRGLLMTADRAPVGLTNRTPQEFFRHGNVTQHYRRLSFYEGVCQDCRGAVTTTAYICDDHEPADDALCPKCDRRFRIRWNFVCDVCKSVHSPAPWVPAIAETAVVAFCYERGVDVHEAMNDIDMVNELFDAFDATVSARDPLEVTVTVELEGDRLTVTLDDSANVVDIEETLDVA